MFLRFVVFVFFFSVVADADFCEPVAQRISRKPQQSRGLALISVRAFQSFANNFVFPLLESLPAGKEIVARGLAGFARYVSR